MVGAGLLSVLLYLVYPTPYEYTRQYPNVIRVNRFTGVRELSTPQGWKSDNQLRKEAEQEQAIKDKAAQEAADIQKVIETQFREKAKSIRLKPLQSSRFVLGLTNPYDITWEMDRTALVEYFTWISDEKTRLSGKNIGQLSAIGPSEDFELRTTDFSPFGNSDQFPTEVLAQPISQKIQRVVTIRITSAREGSSYSNPKTDFIPPIELRFEQEIQ